jgi:hypothetical protein
VLASTGARQGLIDRLTTAAQTVAGISELPAVVATVATELISNACFNAPRGRDGRPLYRDRPRQADLALAPAEAVTVAFGHDDQFFALAVYDNFGALTRGTLVANFVRASRVGDRQIRMQTQGAGVGLYMVLSSAAQLDVRVEPGRRTEIVAVVALAKRYRDFARSGHSLNLYFKEART